MSTIEDEDSKPRFTGRGKGLRNKPPTVAPGISPKKEDNYGQGSDQPWSPSQYSDNSFNNFSQISNALPPQNASTAGKRAIVGMGHSNNVPLPPEESWGPNEPVNGGYGDMPDKHTDKDEEKPLTQSELSVLNKILHDNLIETSENDIEILRSNPDHPLFSVKSFQQMNLNPQLYQGIAAMGYMKPSMIQEKALPCLLSSPPQNMIAQSQSGTGKTATFLLTALTRVNPDQRFCQCICMAPTIELASQIRDVAKDMSRYISKLKIGLAIRSSSPEVDMNGTVTDHVIVGTPGTLHNYMSGRGGVRIDTNLLKVFVLDEADVLIEESGFLQTTRRIRQKIPNTCQILLFSATYTDDVMEFAREIVPNPVIITVRRAELSLKNIRQYFMELNDKDAKYRAVCDIYGVYTVGQSIIFCGTKREAAWLQEKMYTDGHEVTMLSGDLTTEEREAVIQKFRSGECRCLITTNVSSRGLDISQVNLVVNWDMPRIHATKEADCETYLHRIGRSGRFGKAGIAINFVSGSQEFNILLAIERFFSIKIERIDSADVSDLDKIASHPA